MSLAVKPHQAFFLAARTDHAAGLVPFLARIPAVFLSILSPPPRSPHLRLGERGGGDRMLPRFAFVRRAGLSRSRSNASGRWRAVRSGRQARTTVSPWGPILVPAPCTVYASGVRHASRQEPTHRTNGAFPGSPGGRTVALADHACSLHQRSQLLLPPLRGVLCADGLRRLTAFRPRRQLASRAAALSSPPASASPFAARPLALRRVRRSATTRSAVCAPGLRCRSSVPAYCPCRSDARTTGSTRCPAASATRSRPTPRSGHARACCPPC